MINGFLAIWNLEFHKKSLQFTWKRSNKTIKSTNKLP